MPARKIGKTYSSLSGRFYSVKNDIARLYESSLEKDLIYTLEFDHNVRNYEEQPVIIEYLDEVNKVRRYTPDFLINYKNHTPLSSSMKPTLIEVKYRADLWKNWKTLKPKFKAAIDYAEKRGWKFKILTEVEIRTEYQHNARFLLRYVRAKVDADKVDHLLAIINEFEISTPQEMIAASSISPKLQGYYLYTLWYLIATGLISCDHTRKINMNTEIWVNEGLRREI